MASPEETLYLSCWKKQCGMLSSLEEEATSPGEALCSYVAFFQRIKNGLLAGRSFLDEGIASPEEVLCP
jgi:hypothetical protein